ncbi:hypothetical protein [Saccharicrinis fermentans]|nr:hypothetical protein [Saccharicrinis fermentans]
MKTTIYSILILITALLFHSCEKDLMDEVNEGNWNNERNILGINLNKQIGEAVIKRTADEATINITVNAVDLDLSAIAITDLTLSYDATANTSVGEKLDFDNPENKASITVTSKKGETLIWDVFIEPFVNELEGSWSISSFYFMWDDGFGWGNAGEDEVAALLPASASGLDDVITFGEVKGADSDGRVFGDYERTTGDDGAVASFVYESTGVDWSSLFGQLPVGTGQWVLNKDNSITITVDDKSYTTSIFQKEDESTLKIPLNTGAQELDKINWDNYYGDHSNKFIAGTALYYTLMRL